MAIGTLRAIINKVRRLTGTANSFQLTDAQIIDYINSFYLYDLPAQFRNLKLQSIYTFNTVRGIDTYPFDFEHFTTVSGPVSCAKRAIAFYQDPWAFFSLNYNWQYIETLATGDGTTGPYTGTLQAAPVIRSVNNNPIVQTTLAPVTNYLVSPSVPSFQQAVPSRVQNILVSANSSYGSTQNVTDVPNTPSGTSGTLSGDATGTINYETGAISITFSNNVPAGENIQVQYNPALVNRPLSLLFFQEQFTVRPVPDQGYQIELMAIRQPSQALLGTNDPDVPNYDGRPEMLEWWETLAFGASKKIYEDRLDPDGVALMDKGLIERYDLNNTRTYAEIGKQRIPTIFSDQLNQSFGAPGFWFSGGN